MAISTSPISSKSISQTSQTGNGPIWQTSPRLKDIYGDDEVLIHLEATDPDGDTVSYSLAPNSNPLPSGLQIDGITGVIYGISPEVDITTRYDITVRAGSVDGVVDRTFTFFIEPQIISWSPENFGIFDEGQISELRIDVDNFYQIEQNAQFQISNLPSTLDINDRGEIIGNFPYVSQNTRYWPTVKLYYQNRLLLGPTRWSFTVKDVFNNVPVSVYSYIGLNLEQKYDWLRHIRLLVNDLQIYREEDSNFGIVEKPYVPIFNGLKTFNDDLDTLNEYFDKINAGSDPQYRFTTIYLYVKDLEVYEGDHYDVLYYSLMDYGSSDDQIENVYGNPRYFWPNSIVNLRRRLNNIGTEHGEILEPWMGNSFKIGIPLCYLEKGQYKKAIKRFNEERRRRDFVGLEVPIDRIILAKKDGSNWLSSSDNEYQFKFNSDDIGPDYRSQF